MSAFQIPTGFNHRTAAFGYRGGAFSDQRDFVMTAVLVKHPRGDLLIDTACTRPTGPALVQSEDLPTTWSIADLVPLVGTILDTLGLDRVTLVGLSLGGGAALGYALRSPERVERLGLWTATASAAKGLAARPATWPCICRW
jgi:pimeloyl-ACP methyl ester carboxylesterase